MDTDLAKQRAEERFKKNERQAREAVQAWKDYEANNRAVRERTERLRALRLAKEAADAKVAADQVAQPAAKPRKRKAKAKA